jgi:hypothetical protein
MYQHENEDIDIHAYIHDTCYCRCIHAEAAREQAEGTGCRDAGSREGSRMGTERGNGEERGDGRLQVAARWSEERLATPDRAVSLRL